MNLDKIRKITITGGLAGFLFTVLYLLTLYIPIECNTQPLSSLLNCNDIIKGLALPLVSLFIIGTFAYFALRKDIRHPIALSSFSLLFLWQSQKLLLLVPNLIIMLLLSTLLSPGIFFLTNLLLDSLKIARWIKITILVLIFIAFSLLTTTLYLSIIRGII